jgi:hypothetical protein
MILHQEAKKKKVNLIEAFWIYENLCLLQSNPLGLEHFSCEENLQIKFLELFLKHSPEYSTGLLNQMQVVMCSRLDVNPLA